jgi:hypothetical protein
MQLQFMYGQPSLNRTELAGDSGDAGAAEHPQPYTPNLQPQTPDLSHGMYQLNGFRKSTPPQKSSNYCLLLLI